MNIMLIKRLGMTVAVVTGCLSVQACGEKTMSAAEMQLAIGKCFALEGKPTPIYDKDDPLRVFRVDCNSPGK